MYKFVRFVLEKIENRPSIHIDICTVASTPSMTNSVFLFAENQIIFGTVCLICHYLGANTYLCEMCYGDAVWLKGMRCQAAVQQFWVLFPLSPKLEDLSHNGRCRGANDQALWDRGTVVVLEGGGASDKEEHKHCIWKAGRRILTQLKLQLKKLNVQ